jgi:hypothetical protein
VVDDRAEQPVLVAEVPVEDGRADAGLAADVAGRDVAVG